MDDDNDSNLFDFPPKSTGTGGTNRRRVFFDDSSVMEDSPIRTNNGHRSMMDGSGDGKNDKFGTPRMTSSAIMSSDEEEDSDHDEDDKDDDEPVSIKSIVDDSGDVDAFDIEMKKESKTKEPIQITLDESNNSSHRVDVAMKSMASIVISSDDESVPNVVEDSYQSVVVESDEDVVADSDHEVSIVESVVEENKDTKPKPTDQTTKLSRLEEALKFADRLPDKGEKIRMEIASTKQTMNVKVEKTNGAGDGASSSSRRDEIPEPPKDNIGGARPKIVPVPSIRTKAMNPWEVKRNEEMWEQKYAVSAEHHRLYGGKMTDAREREAKVVTQEAISKLHTALTSCPAETDETPDPPGLTVPLLEHQRQALTWLLWRERQQPSGGILADDMGLGKTLTMIALIMYKKYAETDGGAGDRYRKKAMDSQKLIPSEATLVVCPASVMHQWEKEIQRRVKPGKLDVLMYHGPKRETNARRIAYHDVVLTTYGILASDLAEKREMGAGDSSDEDEKSGAKKKTTNKIKEGSPLLKVAWERIILDEAHIVRNHATAQSFAVCHLPAANRWALTGTPLQNQLKDLYALLKFLRYAPFDEFAVWKQWIETKREEDRKRLQTIVKSVLLRRTKDMTSKSTGKALVELPPKRYETEGLTFTPAERKIYDQMFAASQVYVKDVLKSQDQRDNELIKISTSDYSAISTAREHGKIHEQVGYKNPFVRTKALKPDEAHEYGKGGTGLEILVLLLRLRQACVHLTMTKDALDLDSLQILGTDCAPEAVLTKQLNDLSLLDEDLDEDGGGDSKSMVKALFEKTAMSTKVSAVLNRLDHFRKAQRDGPPPKFVLVSQWTQILDILETHLKKRGVSYSSITGSVSVEERGNRIEQFNDLRGGPQVMLLSITAGGVGVNLIGGNHLFIIDLHWNPALEKQACDRIYRVGQIRPVFIHRFIVNDTIEGRVQELQNRKMQMAESVLSGTDTKGLNKLSLRDIKFLFGLSGEPAPMMNQARGASNY